MELDRLRVGGESGGEEEMVCERARQKKQKEKSEGKFRVEGRRGIIKVAI